MIEESFNHWAEALAMFSYYYYF